MRSLMSFRPLWAKRRVILDKIDPEMHKNFECKGWLPLLEVEHPPPVALIREFYSNLSVHSNDSNIKFVKSWIRGEEYVITPKVVASWYNFGTAACVPLHRDPSP